MEDGTTTGLTNGSTNGLINYITHMKHVTGKNTSLPKFF
jgi:hypothetical protein